MLVVSLAEFGLVSFSTLCPGDGPGVGMIALYSGPDTNGKRILIRSGAPPLNNRSSSSCVSQLEGGVQPFSICVFRSEVPLRQV